MPRLFRRTTAQTAVLLCALGATGEAQGFDVKALLVPPAKAIVCRAVAPPPGDSSASVLEFADAPPSTSRLIRIGFDAAGSPLHVTIRSLGRANTELKELQDWGMLMVNFTEKLSVRTRYVRGRVDTSDVVTVADAAAKLPPGAYVLTPHELEQVHDLGVGLWKQRCTSQLPAARSGNALEQPNRHLSTPVE
jgi:hypothetical protein